MITFKKGGVHPEENKLASSFVLENYPIPKQCVVFVGQHLGMPAVARVAKGDTVKVGQLIAQGETFISANVHAPVSGTVAKIEAVADLSGYKKEAIVIDVEDDIWDETIDTTPDLKPEIVLGREEIIAKIKDKGIVGLGGACFPTHVKYMLPPDKVVEYLIINAAECEPYISVDHRIMLEKAEECMIGIEILRKASGAKNVYIGVENNKPDAIDHLTKVSAKYPGIKVIPLKVKYPQGAEKQLIYALTNRKVPDGKLPIEVGVIVNNITTTLAVYEAVQKNKPLIETYTTVSGKFLTIAHNYKIRIGTSVADILQSTGIPENTGKIIAGGPMMGKAIANLQSYTVKGMNSLLLLSGEEGYRERETPCLRCGKCVSVCPMGLTPNLLHTLSELKRLEDCEKEKIMNCIECGSCQFQCPACRPLLDYIRLGKARTGNMIRNRKI